MLLMELRGLERYKIAGKFEATPSKITEILRKPRIKRLRDKICNSVERKLINQNEQNGGQPSE